MDAGESQWLVFRGVENIISRTIYAMRKINNIVSASFGIVSIEDEINKNQT